MHTSASMLFRTSLAQARTALVCTPAIEPLSATLDSGACKVFRDQSSEALPGEDADPGVPLQVTIAGDQSVDNAKHLPSDEVIMPGEMLIGTGVTVNRGRFTHAWSPTHGYITAQITPEQETKIAKILFTGVNAIEAQIKNGCPMITSSQAMVLRRAADFRSSQNQESVTWTAQQAQEFVCWWTQTSPRPSAQFLTSLCAKFDRLISNDRKIRRLLEQQSKSPQFDASSLTLEWANIRVADITAREKGSALLSYLHGLETADDPLSTPLEPLPLDAEFAQTEREVQFGDTQMFHYFEPTEPDFSDASQCADSTETEELVSALRVQADQVIDTHFLTHLPAVPNCPICREAKRQHVKFNRKRSQPADGPQVDPREVDGPFLVMDWAGPLSASSNGCTWAAIILDLHAGSLRIKACPRKRDGMVARALHETRMLWSIESKPFTFHTDNEPVLKTPPPCRSISPRTMG